MVLIFDDASNTEARYIRNELIRRRIPAAISTDASMLAYSLVIVRPLSVWYNVLSENTDPETVLLFDNAALGDLKRREFELERLISRIEDVLFIKYGFDPYTVVKGAFYDSFDVTSYYGTECYLADAERLIVRFLVVCGEKRASAVIIRAFCLDMNSEAGAVAVHISKINSRLFYYSNIKAINSKRNFGYRLSIL